LRAKAEQAKSLSKYALWELHEYHYLIFKTTPELALNLMRAQWQAVCAVFFFMANVFLLNQQAGKG